MRITTSTLILFFSCSTASAGLFDDLVDKAKKTADEVVSDSIDKLTDDKTNDSKQQQSKSSVDSVTEDQQTIQQKTPVLSNAQPVQTSKSNYDPSIVKPIQQQLNEQGYNVGTVDGLYGKGTKHAIMSYQTDHGLKADGVPSQSLLSQLATTQGKQPTQSKKTTAGSLPEPTPASLLLAAVHFRPDSLDKESTLKYVLYHVHPETNKIMSNEFAWHKQKAQLKAQLLQEAKATQLQFEVKPWRDKKGWYRPIQLQEYDFDKSAFRIQPATGTGSAVMLRGLIVSDSRMEKQYPRVVNSIPIAVDAAEKINNYFGNHIRVVYLGYRFNVSGTNLDTGRPLPIVNFADNTFELYARENKPMGNKMQTSFKLMAKAPIPYDEAILAEESKPKEFANFKSADTNVVKTAVIDGIHFGMSPKQAIAVLTANGFKMEKPGQPNKQYGLRVKGSRRTKDGIGSMRIYFTSMNNQIYEFSEQISYYKPLSDAQKNELAQYYKNKLILPFKEARYSTKNHYGKIAFSDETPPPYAPLPSTPYAEVMVTTEQSVNAYLRMTWKDLVGAKW